MVNMWKPNPGRLADLKTGMRIAKEMHMKLSQCYPCLSSIWRPVYGMLWLQCVFFGYGSNGILVGCRSARK